MNALLAQVLAAIIANLTLMNSGMMSYWTSPALPKLLASDSDLPLTASQGSWVASFSNFGAAFGPVFVGLFADRIGRKWTLYLASLPMLASWVMIGLATNYQMLYAARFIGGLGGGAAFALVPMYLGEIADHKIRGGLGTIMTTMVFTGALVTDSTGPWVSRQILALISSMPTVIFLISFLWMPETPYYYMMKGKRDAAHSSLMWLRRRTVSEEELTTIANDIHLQQQNQASATKLITNLGNRRALFIVLGLYTFQQFSGAFAIVSYGSMIFTDAGASISGDVSVIITNVVSIVAGICVGLSTDIAGRRPILISSMTGLFISLVAIGVFYHLQDLGQDVSGYTWLPLAGVLGFYVMYTIGVGSLTYVITSELFPTDVKALGNMVSTMYSSLGGMAVTKLYQVVADAFGIYTVFYGFAVCTAIGIIFMYLCVPETKGRSLQDIQSSLNTPTKSTDDISKH